ncbi:MAG: hypothetical protein QGH42_06060 [Kiritimatiellia bacterium]|jgi:PAT family beta-lactamase induction signal transducer AmpG|nr:hypothetical protein [Kiritimatiellia bacterium]
MNKTVDQPRVSPWSYIPTLYLPFGIIMGIGNSLPGMMFKLLGFSNEVVGMLAGIGLIASFRFVFAPWLDAAMTKRRLSLVTLIGAFTLAGGAAALIYAQPGQAVFLPAMVAILFVLAIVAASHETAADGYYIRVLSPKRQAEFIGIKTAAMRGGLVFTTMGLIYAATEIAKRYDAVNMESPDKTGFYIGFSIAFLLAAITMLVCSIYNKFMIPKIPQDQPVKQDCSLVMAVAPVLKEYLLQHRVILIMLLILLYRFGEGFLAMKGPFYLDPLADGGLASEASDMPLYSILTDLPWMILGGVLGGYVIKWWGLKRTFIPLAAFMSLPNLFYVWLAASQPMHQITLFGETLNSSLLIASSLESLGYGMSFSAMFYYMHIMATECGKNKTSILAISFALMNVGWTVPCMMSGFVQAHIGYMGVFIVSSTVGLTALLIIPFLPMPNVEKKRAA